MKTKKIILITIITAIILLVAWLVYGMLQSDENINTNLDNKENSDVVEEEMGEINQTNTRREEIDRKNDNYKEAVASSDYNNCLNLEDQNIKNTCIARIAINNVNLDLCQEIKDSEKLSDCKNKVYHKIAIQDNNINVCSLIEDSFWHESCLNKIIIANDYNQSLCDEINDFEDSNSCKEYIKFNQALETNDCDLLKGEMKQECESTLNINENKEEENIVEEGIIEEEKINEEELKNMDNDNDGLSDYDEINIYDTNPNNSDTDGDSYLDGEEVENGFNPLSA
jgi:flagellar basal body-associated protein FliL